MPQTIPDLIAAKGLGIREIATAAEVSPTTVMTAKARNAWPVQRRPRLALARVLGVQGDPLTSEQAVADAVGAEAAHAADVNQAGVA